MKYDAAFRRLFWSRIRKSKKGKRCWNWTLSTGENGYGQLACKRYSPTKLATHRVAWELANGRCVPARKHVLHTCDNRRCCRPSHLFLGTNLDNIADCVAKGRTTRGEKHPMVKITRVIARKIRKRVAKGETQAAVAKDVGLDFRTVSQIVTHRRWKEDTS